MNIELKKDMFKNESDFLSLADYFNSFDISKNRLKNISIVSTINIFCGRCETSVELSGENFSNEITIY